MTKDANTFRYRARNWSKYNCALIVPGGLTFWIDEAALAMWRNTQAPLGAGVVLSINSSALKYLNISDNHGNLAENDHSASSGRGKNKRYRRPASSRNEGYHPQGAMVKKRRITMNRFLRGGHPFEIPDNSKTAEDN